MKPRKQTCTVLVTLCLVAIVSLPTVAASADPTDAAAPGAGEENPYPAWADRLIRFLSRLAGPVTPSGRPTVAGWLPPACPTSCPPTDFGSESQNEPTDHDEDDPRPTVDPTGG
ncbi:MAG: hypothetical protein AAF481_14655 [Acidobacteriota bacterium]